MASETTRSRFLKIMRGEMPGDRLPLIEWATWWDQTIKRWHGEGLPKDLDKEGLKRYFGLDVDWQMWCWQRTGNPKPKYEGGEQTRWIDNADDYQKLLPYLYPKPGGFDRTRWQQIGREQASGNGIAWMTFEGFFWWPRVLFGIEQHLYAFVDQAELMHRINQDQVNYLLRLLDEATPLCVPDFITFAEDMSYNHGPMIGKDMFDEFMAPYYKQVVPRMRERGIIPIIDSDGDVEPLVPWFEEVGLEGILPLERMAGVDVNRLRRRHPKWKMIGAFDKTVMHLGEEAIRAEFERLLPAIRSRYFIPSVDHQTPPGVSLEQYRVYLRVLREYAAKAVK